MEDTPTRRIYRLYKESQYRLKRIAHLPGVTQKRVDRALGTMEKQRREYVALKRLQVELIDE